MVPESTGTYNISCKFRQLFRKVAHGSGSEAVKRRQPSIPKEKKRRGRPKRSDPNLQVAKVMVREMEIVNFEKRSAMSISNLISSISHYGYC